jgi:hypothetical protein
MTYALGWKTENEVFLSADTAITTYSDDPELEFDVTSFGENHVADSEKKVEERLVKLFLKDGIGLTFAGNVRLAFKIAETFYKEIESGSTPKEALQWSINLHNPRPTDKVVKIIIAYYQGGHPYLLSFNSQDDHKIREDEVLIQVGSMPKAFIESTKKWISTATLNTQHKPALHLTAMLGVFQMYSIFGNLITTGVGGAFAGLYIDEHGGNWQPDIMFIMHRQGLVSTCFRNGCLVVNSPMLGTYRCFISCFPSGSLEVIKTQASEGLRRGVEVQREAKFDFVIIVDMKGMTLTLVEMQKNRKHELLWLKPYENAEGKGTEIATFPELLKVIEGKSQIKNIPYSSPKIKEIPKEKIRRILIK